MIALVDESGCTGVKLESGSTPMFSVIAVLFKSDEVAAQCKARIGQLQRELKITKEFHFSKCSDTNRQIFFQEVLPFDFNYFGVAIDKTKFVENKLIFNDRIIESLVVPSFGAVANQLDNATVVFDRTGSSDFRRSLAQNLKRAVNQTAGMNAIGRVKHETSHTNSLLQLADMTCGAVARSFAKERKACDVYRRQIQSKELFVAEYP